MSEPAAPAADDAKAAKPKSKKMLIIIIAVVLVLIGASVGGWLYLSKKNAAAEDAEGEDGPPAVAAAPAHDEHKTPPTFLPMDNMVVNLADPGGERMAQIGITIELSDAHAVDKVKAYLPSIRSAVLLLISQRTAAELLAREGKEQLATDILKEVSRPLGFADAHKDEATTEKAARKKKVKGKPKTPEETNPVSAVLFSSFIVQ